MHNVPRLLSFFLGFARAQSAGGGRKHKKSHI